MCERAIELMAGGHSLAAVAGAIGVRKSTLHRLRAEHPEFDEAIEIGAPQAVLHWEKQLLDVAKNGGSPGHVSACIFGLKNRAPQEWSDKQSLEHSGSLATESAAPVIVQIQTTREGEYFDADGNLVRDENSSAA